MAETADGAVQVKRRDYAVALDFAPFDNVTFTSSFDRSDQTERFDDSTQENSDTVDDQWEFELDASFWYDRNTVSPSFPSFSGVAGCYVNGATVPVELMAFSVE